MSELLRTDEAIRADMRVALVVYRPAAFVDVDLSA